MFLSSLMIVRIIMDMNVCLDEKMISLSKCFTMPLYHHFVSVFKKLNCSKVVFWECNVKRLLTVCTVSVEKYFDHARGHDPHTERNPVQWLPDDCSHSFCDPFSLLFYTADTQIEPESLFRSGFCHW